ncbi:class I SAM-dependent methyltransferase [Acuticoccus yangtzensis]|uniref:class I SAM-dependent methyltransferase n=1 Tax=Acuticoccus yangtzensis TaxID=1443441 RepID=UPI000949A1E6|nr:SAM-dependent methyltransferase [Acuticoccus yangtzensis]
MSKDARSPSPPTPTPVAERLIRRIGLNGPISVADFMSACLTDPDGYYASQEPFGTEGDFVTAPEISQMFGELIGAFLLDRWISDGRPAPFDLVELGPGRGTLMHDVLRVMGRDPRFVRSSRVVLVEASERLKQAQRHRLAPLHPNIAWADAPPLDRPFYLVANEFFDALPVRQIVSRGGRWFERVVGLTDGELAFGLSPFPVTFRAPVGGAEGALREVPPSPEGAVRELRPAADIMMADIARAIATHGVGAALVIDYGYDSPGDGETLQAVRAHQSVDVLDRPGESDLSAHVDFSALAAASVAAGAFAHGPVGQGAMLLQLGLLERAGRLGAGADADGRAAIEAAVHRLAGDGEGEMGTLFRALAVTARAAPPPGFQPPKGSAA